MTHPTWNSLSLKIRSLIINSIMEHQDFRRAWFICRQVSRSFKEATEHAFTIRVMPNAKFSFYISGFDGLRTGDPVSRQYRYCRTLLMNLPFSRLTEDGTGAVFRKNGSQQIKHDETPTSEVEIHIGDDWLPFHVMEPILWKDAINSYLHPGTAKISPAASIGRSGLKFELPHIEHVNDDCEEQTVTIPCSPLISILMAQEMELGEELKLVAMEDPENILASRPSVEQGTIISRFPRFEQSMITAVNELIRRQGDGSRQAWEYFEYGLEDKERVMSSWYDEWAKYVGL
ncbi:hypothetical protein F4804DRAFT_229068 [Jackrogersella minutella]|nr:hypothetical protein F4804DRAFT_229068 [Jackrogersella minutella]